MYMVVASSSCLHKRIAYKQIMNIMINNEHKLKKLKKNELRIFALKLNLK